MALVDEVGKHFRSRLMLCHVGQWDENGEETQDMEDKNCPLKPRQQLASNDIDSGCKDSRSPGIKGLAPRRGRIVGVGEND